MYIIQMADLHVGSKYETNPNEIILIHKSVELIKTIVPKGSQILLCICGDIIDSYELSIENRDEIIKRYQYANDIISEYKNLLEDFGNISVRCCPGNHDITHEEEFAEFVKKVDEQEISIKKLKSCYNYELEKNKTNCVFVNSCDGNQYDTGKIDYDKLENVLRGLPTDQNKIIVLHHTIMSMFDDDASSIKNAAKLLTLIDKYKVIGVLHGHIHGRDILKVGKNQCKIIGIGAMFTRNNPNVNSQFNIIQCENGFISKVLNCRYNADGGISPWSVCELIDESLKTNYEGESFKEVYEQLLGNLKISSILHNVSMRINNTYEKFVNDLKKYLDDDILTIGDRKYNYFKLAEMWEAEQIPEELYFNHGSNFAINGKSGIKFVEEQLRRKPSSNRIVLSSYNMENVVEYLDDSAYLPSLESIQFGKGKDNNSDKLYVHMHFRALEANRFLKINICEIYYLLNILKTNSVEFDNVDITISAFRIQAKEHFNCFIKARMDDNNFEADLCAYVFNHDIDTLCKLLKEKRDARETITKVQGVQIIYRMMEAHNKVKGDAFYTLDIIGILKKVLDTYKELDKLHKKSSFISQDEIDCEEKIDKLLGNLINKLQELKKDRKEKV